MSIPNDRRYAKTHEWFKADGDSVTVGISQYAVDELTDITFVELPSVGTKIAVGDAFGEVESVKATSELFAAVAGTVTAINEQLADDPGLLNEDPYEKAWLVKMSVDDATGLETLLDAEAYERSLA